MLERTAHGWSNGYTDTLNNKEKPSNIGIKVLDMEWEMTGRNVRPLGGGGGVGMGGGCPSHWGGLGEPPPGNFENFNSIWCTLVKSRGSFMQKEQPLKRKNYTCIGILLFTIP